MQAWWFLPTKACILQGLEDFSVPYKVV